MTVKRNYFCVKFLKIGILFHTLDMESLFGFRFKSADNFLKPQRLYYGREYSKRIYEKGIAKDNLYFLKLQYEKLLLLARAKFREQRKLKRKIKELANEIDKVKERIDEKENRKFQLDF
ncbi:uncharacterized protein LOC117785818 [Drosophila innubila]|uniref:uncharacterized protein LOC117785818 n=1 Tax=Drosophila innubila TaxID=198719 RepID=UPI00148E361A|nr:uncharacterized protein LOC117785818 [Drosophila innubila]